jgi:hypothetical protein
LQFLALTAVDTVTTIAEIISTDDKTSAHVAMKFENEWLSCYPCPLHYMHDQGPEFTSLPFQPVLAVKFQQQLQTFSQMQSMSVSIRPLKTPCVHCCTLSSLRIQLKLHPLWKIAMLQPVMQLILLFIAPFLMCLLVLWFSIVICFANSPHC